MDGAAEHRGAAVQSRCPLLRLLDRVRVVWPEQKADLSVRADQLPQCVLSDSTPDALSGATHSCDRLPGCSAESSAAAKAFRHQRAGGQHRQIFFAADLLL